MDQQLQEMGLLRAKVAMMLPKEERRYLRENYEEKEQGCEKKARVGKLILYEGGGALGVVSSF